MIARFDVVRLPEHRALPSGHCPLSSLLFALILVQRVPNPLGAQTGSLCSDPYSLTRCFNSQTRSAARSKALVRARVPAAGRSRETTFVAPLPLRERAFGLRPFDLVLRTRLAAGVVTVKCPFPFMIRFLSSFQAQAI